MKVCTVGGFQEVGKNMTALNLGDDVVLFDAGVHLPAIIELQGDNVFEPTINDLRNVGALPNDLILDDLGWADKVRAIVISHAHLDHVGGVQYIAKRYPNAEIIGTPFTMAVLDSLVADSKGRNKIRNKMTILKSNSTYMIKGKNRDHKLEFVHATHSTLQCVYPVLHTDEGAFFYALDFKFDNYPVMGDPPNYKRLKQIGRNGVKLLIIDSLYSGVEKKSGSERVARHLIEEAFSFARNKKAALFITTFSSHIERIKSIVEFARKTNRKIIFMGRSMNKYINAAISVNQCPFKRGISIIKYRRQINSMLRKIDKERDKYLVICTGHQGEEGSILDRISRGETPFKFKEGDNLIFSSSVIPVPVNLLSREKMDKKLRSMGVKIQADVHVHGHGSREDLRVMLEMLKPKHIIPAHGSLQQETPMIDLAEEFGYKFGETSHLSSDGKVLDLK